MQVLIAPNAFKNSLDAASAAHAIRSGLKQSNLACQSICFPVGDGGDGTGKLLVDRLGGNVHAYAVHDPLGKQVMAPLGWIASSRTAIIELADASGLRLVSGRLPDPLHANTRGTGELMMHALDMGAKKILVCIGGSATTDGACGLLQALGVEWLDAAGHPLEAIPGNLQELADIDLGKLDPRIRTTEIVVLCDVNNPLLGINGTAAIFAPQKGADPSQVKKLELCLSRLREVMLAKTGKEMDQVRGGAAGGVAAGMAAFLGARLVDGIEYFLDLTRFDEVLSHSQLLITGEGSLDLQTLEGKAPYGVARRAKQLGISVIAMAGKIDPEAESSLSACFDAMLVIQPGLTDLKEAMRHTARNLTRTAKTAGNLISLFKGTK